MENFGWKALEDSGSLASRISLLRNHIKSKKRFVFSWVQVRKASVGPFCEKSRFIKYRIPVLGEQFERSVKFLENLKFMFGSHKRALFKFVWNL